MQYKYQTIVVPFLHDPILPQVTSLCGYMMGHWPNFIPVLAKIYPKLWCNDEPLNFFSFV